MSFRRYYLDKMLHDMEFYGRVLDVGGRKIRKRGDFTPPADKVDSWQYLNIDASSNPDYLSSADKIPVEDNFFDMVIMTEVLEHLENPEDALNEVYRVLKHNGKLVASMPFLNSIHKGPHDFQRWLPDRLRRELQKTGFEAEKIEPMGGIAAVISDLIIKYTYQHPTLLNRLLRKLVRIQAPLIKALDSKTQRKDIITTGFFIIAVKRLRDG